MFDEFRYDIKVKKPKDRPKLDKVEAFVNGKSLGYILDSGHTSFGETRKKNIEMPARSLFSGRFHSGDLIMTRHALAQMFRYSRGKSRHILSSNDFYSLSAEMEDQVTAWNDEKESRELMEIYMSEVSFQLNSANKEIKPAERIKISSSKDTDSINEFLKRKREVRQNDNIVDSRQVFSKGKTNNRRFTNGSRFFK